MLTLLACAILTSALAAPFVGPEKVTELNASTAATNASAGSKHEHVGEDKQAGGCARERQDRRSVRR